MTVNDFITLEDSIKTETVLKAPRLTNYSNGIDQVLTCDLGEFCVEVIYNIKKKKISRFRFFRSDLHTGYIGQIDVRA